jgi:hypothetical protein
MMENKVLAEIAYQAYGNWVEWKTPQGKRIPSWGQLPINVRNAWTAAAETIAVQVRKAELNKHLAPNLS